MQPQSITKSHVVQMANVVVGRMQLKSISLAVLKCDHRDDFFKK